MLGLQPSSSWVLATEPTPATGRVNQGLSYSDLGLLPCPSNQTVPVARCPGPRATKAGSTS
eukprot:4967758-Alexandrium_andersonii.AAC.1